MRKEMKDMLLLLCICVGHQSRMLTYFEVEVMEDRAKQAHEKKEAAEKKLQKSQKEFQEMQIRHHVPLMEAAELRRQVQEIKKERGLSDAKLKLNNMQKYAIGENEAISELDERRWVNFSKEGSEIRSDLELLEAQKNLNASTLEKQVSDERSELNQRLKEAKSEARSAKLSYYKEVVKAKIPQSIKDFFVKISDRVSSATSSVGPKGNGLSIGLSSTSNNNQKGGSELVIK